jgi:hypothetical protein
MKIALAQLKKDIRCQRTPLILWIICLVLGLVPLAITWVVNKPGTESALLNLSDTQKVVGIMSYVAILMGCITAAGFGMFLLLPILVTRVVHDDPLMGTSAFWRTRPIPRPQLMLAKALFIGVLLSPLLVGMSTGGGQVGQDRFWPAMTAWIAAVAALAAITPGMGAWFGYGAAFLFGKLIFSGIIDALWNHYHGPEALFSDEALHPLIATGKFLHLNASDFFHLCYLAGFVGVFIHQYLTLRTRRSLLLFIAVLVTVGVLQMISGPGADSSPGAVIQFNSNVQTTH